MSGSFKGLVNITSELTEAETWAENLVWTSVKLPIADTFIISFMDTFMFATVNLVSAKPEFRSSLPPQYDHLYNKNIQI